MYYTYILKCEDDSYYIGYSNDPQKRFEKHKAGKGAKYTRSHKPVSIEITIPFETKSEAMKAEYQLKQFSHIEKSAIIEISKLFITKGFIDAKLKLV